MVHSDSTRCYVRRLWRTISTTALPGTRNRIRAIVGAADVAATANNSCFHYDASSSGCRHPNPSGCGNRWRAAVPATISRRSSNGLPPRGVVVRHWRGTNHETSFSTYLRASKCRAERRVVPKASRSTRRNCERSPAPASPATIRRTSAHAFHVVVTGCTPSRVGTSAFMETYKHTDDAHRI